MATVQVGWRIQAWFKTRMKDARLSMTQKYAMP
jgi:hypothetical protein